MHLFLVCSKVFEALWESGPAKTGPAGPVSPPLYIDIVTSFSFVGIKVILRVNWGLQNGVLK